MITATKLGCGLFVLATLTPFSSAKPLPLEAPDPGRGIIGIKVSVNSPARMGSCAANAVYFVRVTEDSDRFGAESLINSNYTKGHNVYLLNAKPGRYVAVGCEFTMLGSGERGITVFSEAAILQTEVEVMAGSIVFMGDIDAQSSTKLKEADQAEAHYLRMVAPTAANQNFMARALTRHFVYTSTFTSIERSKTVATEFWNEAIEKHFKNEPAWTNRIARPSAAPVGVAAESPSAPTPPEVAAPVTAAFLAHLKGNIPAKRLKGGTYTSPDGGFDLTVPPLISPGAKAEERQIAPGQTGVFFCDDFGNMYAVIWTDNSQLKRDLETIAAESPINEALREKQIVPTARGSELRMAGVAPGASPIVSETEVNGKITQTKLDLHEALSVFVTGMYLYEVTAGVTAVHQRSDAELFALAKEHLDAFLAGLHINSGDAPSEN
jgi:hypothetical protein